MRVALAFLLLAACAAPVTPPQPDAAPAARQGTVASLAGHWRVAGIDGGEVAGTYGIALSASDREIWWDPRCAGMVRSYRIDGTRFSAGSAQGSLPGPGQPVCLPAIPVELGRVMRAIDSATTIRRTANNGIELSGGGHSLLLFSQ